MDFDSLANGVQLKANVNESILYLLGILNSHLLNYLHNTVAQSKNKVFAKVLAKNLKNLPIRSIDFSSYSDKAHHDKLVNLVEQMLDLHKKLAKAKAPQTITTLKRQIEATDRQIDQLVYELYGLTKKEIKIVEESVG